MIKHVFFNNQAQTLLPNEYEAWERREGGFDLFHNGWWICRGHYTFHGIPPSFNITIYHRIVLESGGMPIVIELFIIMKPNI